MVQASSVALERSLGFALEKTCSEFAVSPPLVLMPKKSVTKSLVGIKKC